MEKDLVYLVWTDVNTGNKYQVAELYKQYFSFDSRNPRIRLGTAWTSPRKYILF